MILLSAEGIGKRYTDKKLLEDVSLFLNEGDKIGIIGRNGSGKSTLLRCVTENEEPDVGHITKAAGLRIGYLPQNPSFYGGGSIIDQVCRGTSTETAEMTVYEAKRVLTRLGFTDMDKGIDHLSGGERKRVSIARVLVQPSELLVMDEPTNHLDSTMIAWLEAYLKKFTGAMLMVTHDRYFLDRIMNRIVEISDGHLYQYEKNYTNYLILKADREERAAATERKNQSLYRKELAWIRRGVKARGTKSKSRIERFERLSDREQPRSADAVVMESVSSRLGKKTIEINRVAKSYGGRCLVKDFELIVPRGARIGIIGANGCGKSTLLAMIAGVTPPDEGTIDYGETVKIGYFPQEYAADAAVGKTRVIDYIKEVAEMVETDEGTVTASKMLERFLFAPDAQWNAVEKLSGGERRRLYLLRILMSAPNILLLDEPTNDLDVETLTVFEDYLERFSGAILTVSHDRYFLDRVVDTVLAFEENGALKRYNGGYTDYLEKKTRELQEEAPETKKLSEPNPAQPEKERPKKLKFSFKEQFEYDRIDDEVAALEAQLAETEQGIAAEASHYEALGLLLAKKEALETALAEKMDRWVYLNDLAERIKQEKE